MDHRIYYTDGYKHQLKETAVHQLPSKLTPADPINTQFISIDRTGTLTIRAGYAWDGASGPTIGTKTTKRGSLIHDSLYQLMREGALSRDMKKAADEEMKRIMIEDGMTKIRAAWFQVGVDMFGKSATIQHKNIMVAP